MTGSIADLLAGGPTISFEFFPPKTPEGEEQLRRCLDELEVVDPSFVSVTYGAGGSTRERTRDLVIEIDGERTYPAMPHLTCMGHTSAELVDLLDDYARSGIENILALAGDPPADGSPAGGDFRYASELVDLVRGRGDFTVAVAAFPEGHPRSPSLSEDRRRLADKLQSADFGITQFFFRAEYYLRMVDDLAALGCDTPVIPGIIPMVNPEVIRRLTAMNGAWFPEDLAERVTSAGPADRNEIIVDAAAELIETLRAHGVPGVHLYGLNRSETVLAVLDRVR
ncbi:MAG: methylenetetrahydrofolate reductase [Acidimicrobiales bacterium]